MKTLLALLTEIAPDMKESKHIRLSGDSICIDTRAKHYNCYTIITPKDGGYIVKRDWNCQLGDFGVDDVVIP